MWEGMAVLEETRHDSDRVNVRQMLVQYHRHSYIVIRTQIGTVSIGVHHRHSVQTFSTVLHTVIQRPTA